MLTFSPDRIHRVGQKQLCRVVVIPGQAGMIVYCNRTDVLRLVPEVHIQRLIAFLNRVMLGDLVVECIAVDALGRSLVHLANAGAFGYITLFNDRVSLFSASVALNLVISSGCGYKALSIATNLTSRRYPWCSTS